MGCLAMIPPLNEAVCQDPNYDFMFMTQRKFLRKYNNNTSMVLTDLHQVPTKKFNYLYVFECVRILILDATDMSIKYEGKGYVFGKLKFSDSDNTLVITSEIEGNVYTVKLKFEGDKITQIENTQKSLNLNRNYTYIYRFENGSKLYFTAGPTPSTTRLVYENNGNQIEDKDIHVNDEDLTHLWHNDKYILLAQSRKYCQNLIMFELKTFKKVGEIPIDYFQKRPVLSSAITVLPLDDKTLVISVVGLIYIVDIDTFKITKEFVLYLYSSFYSHYKLSDDTIYSIAKNGVLIKWKTDGSIIEKNCGTTFREPQRLAEFILINNNTEIAYCNNSSLIVEAI